MSKLRILFAVLASLCALLISTREAHATHFRYGNITYTVPDPVNAPTTVRFDVVTAWRQAFIGTTTLVFGDGQQNPDTAGAKIGEGTDAANDPYQVQRYSVEHTYPAKSVYTAYFTSCCRISELVNAGDDSFYVSAIVDLTAGNTGNPVSAVPPIFQLQTGGIRTIAIPGIDPDGAPVHCRFATPAESLATVNPPVIPGGAAPTLTDTPNGCTFTWNTAQGMAGQKYSVSIFVESFNGPTLSTANLDFIIELTAAPPPSCTGGGAFDVDLGTAFEKVLTGTNVGGGTLKMTNVGTFGSLSPAPGTSQASPFQTTYSIAPSIGDSGVQIMTIVYANAQHLSGFCTVAIRVPQCPVFGDACSIGIGGCQSNGFKYCQAGVELCSAVEGQPEPEKCDMIDNNCDGTVDEGEPETGLPCTSPAPGICAPGTSLCNAGTLECIPDIEPGSVAEECDGVDQDCDGVVDDGFGVGTTCIEGDGQCNAAGKVVCDGNGGTTCDAEPGPPTAEICDGKDNDCDQMIDEDFDLGGACTGGVGACVAAGVIVCDGAGSTKCNAVPGAPGTEQCGNAVDENCDGTLDDGCADTDLDGLFDEQETAAGTDPTDADCDDDGVLDGSEPEYALDTDGDGLINAFDPDSDNDGLLDGTELGLACDHPHTDATALSCRADADPASTTDPLSADSDSGGASDGSEDVNLDGKVDSGETDASGQVDDGQVSDADGDGLGDKVEEALGSLANDADTDDDGLPDGQEANPSIDSDGDGLLSALDVDSDNDGLFDGMELGKDCNGPDTDTSKKHCKFDGDPATTTGVLTKDTDGGGATDGSEDGNVNGVKGGSETDPKIGADDGSVLDTDGDGLSDALEATLGSAVNDVDSDDDGVLDGAEANPSDDADGDGQKNVMDPDSDNDGVLDGTELGLDCSNPDTDVTQSHCLADADEGATKTNPLLADSDGGGTADGDEDLDHDGAKSESETDPNDPSDDVAIECTADSECEVGQVCDGTDCVAGCREGSRGCETGLECTSTDETIGECKEPTGAGGAGGGGGEEPPADSGCGCRTSGSSDDGALGVIALAGLAALAAKRRRRR